MNEELIEALADRIRLMIGQSVLENCDVSFTVARECLRQMQWNRAEGMDGDRDKPWECTLAPPDWKPS